MSELISSRYFFIFLLCAYAAIGVLAIYAIGPYAWDDGAITLGYARTLAESGTFSLNPASEVVEGTSSILFALLVAAGHYAFHFDFYQIIRFSQFLALFFSVATIFSLLYFSRESGVSEKKRKFAVLALISLPFFFAEIMNGMEMTLFAFLLVFFHGLFSKKSDWIIVVIPLLLLTRFEAVFYLVFSLMVFIAVFLEEKRYGFRVLFWVVFFFLVISLARYLVFSDVLPNTIWAKMNPPYSAGHDSGLAEQLGRKWLGIESLLSTTGVFVFFSAIVFYFKKSESKTDIGFFLVLSFVVFSLVAGKNWGYSGRMYFAFIPLVALMVFNGADLSCKRKNDETPGKGRFLDLYGALLIVIVLTHLCVMKLHGQNVASALTGASYQGKIDGLFVENLFGDILNDEKEFSDWYGITPENYKITGMTVDSVRVYLGLDVINFMAPDVGGLGLCCERINVLDSALLTNKFLAKNGYKEFSYYLERMAPDLIETHGVWSVESGVYDSFFFKNNYDPVILNNNLLWLRHDHALVLLKKFKHVIVHAKDTASSRYGGTRFDLSALKAYGKKIYKISLGARHK